MHPVTVSASPAPSMSARARWAPSLASWWATARPIPEPAPVTAATRPVKDFTPVPFRCAHAAAVGAVEVAPTRRTDDDDEEEDTAPGDRIARRRGPRNTMAGSSRPLIFSAR